MRETTNPHPADAVSIPASARGAFHLPPACHPTGGAGGIPRSLSVPLLDGHAEVAV